MKSSAQDGVTLDFDGLMRLQHLGRAMRPGRSRSMTGLPGGFIHRQRGRGLEVNDLRPWLFGDDIRHIDRNATARTGVQHVRTFRDERDRTLLLMADFRPSMMFGTRRALRSVAAAECLALAGWSAVSQGVRVASLATGMTNASMPPGRGLRHMSSIFGLWTRTHAESLAHASLAEKPLSSMLETAAQLVPSGGIILVATSFDTPGEDFESTVHWLVRRNDVRFILVRDAFERAPPPGIYPYIANDNTKGIIKIARDFVSPVAERCAYLNSLGVTAIIADTDSGPEALAETLETLDV
jgi:uncharacterized protein (DUF58 family)